MSARRLPSPEDDTLEKVRLLRDQIETCATDAYAYSRAIAKLLEAVRGMRTVPDDVVTSAKAFADGARAAVERAKAAHGDLKKAVREGETIAIALHRDAAGRALGRCKQAAGNAGTWAQQVEGRARGLREWAARHA